MNRFLDVLLRGAMTVWIACAAGSATASSLFDGTTADLWLIDADTGRLTGVDLGPWLDAFSGPGGPVYTLQGGEEAVINTLSQSSVAMSPGQPVVSLAGLGDPADDGGLLGQTRLDITPASGAYDGTVSVKLRVSTALLASPGNVLQWSVTGGPGVVSRLLGPASLTEPGAEVQGGYYVAATIPLVRDGAYTISATLKDGGGQTVATTDGSYTLASEHAHGFRRDTDGDGIPDLVEAAIGLDPDSDDWLVDSDGDGWSDFDEWLRRYCLDGDGVPDPSSGNACLDADGNPLDTDSDGWSDFDEKVRRTRFDDLEPSLAPEDGETIASASYLERLRRYKDFPAARRLYEVERVVSAGQLLPEAGPEAEISVDQQNDEPVISSYRDGAVQSIKPAADNLAGIDLRLAGGDALFDDLTLLVWADALRSGQPLVTSTLTGVATTDGDLAEFRFPAVPVTPGSTLYLEIRADEAFISVTTLSGPYQDGAVVEASGLQSGGLLFGGEADLWFRTWADGSFDGAIGGRPAGTHWSAVDAAAAAGESFYDPDDLLDPGEISWAGLTFADVADRKEIAVAAGALATGEWPAMRLPAGEATVLAAHLQVGAGSSRAAEAVYKAWLDAIRDATPARLLDEVGVGTWTTADEWRAAFVAYLTSELALDVALATTEDAAVAVSLIEAALSEESRLRGGAAQMLFAARDIDRDLVDAVENDLQRFGGDALRLGDVLASLAAAGAPAEPLAALADRARRELRDPAPGTRSDAAFSAFVQQSYDPACQISSTALAELQAFPQQFSEFVVRCPDYFTDADRTVMDAADADRRHRLRTLLLPGAASAIAGDASLLAAGDDSDIDGRANGFEIGVPLPYVTLPWLDDTDGDLLVDGDDICPVDPFNECSGTPLLPRALAGVDVLVSEPTDGTSVAVISISLERVYDEPVVLEYQAVIGTGDTATAGVDFDPSIGQVTIRPGERVALITVMVFQDGVDEGQETFTIRLLSADNAVIDGDGVVRVAINDTAGTASPPNAILVAGELAVDERRSLSIDASPSVDPAGQNLGFSWRQLGSGVPMVSLTGADTAVVSFNAPAVLVNTQIDFEVTVTNESGLTDTAVASVIVRAYNDPPVVLSVPRFQVAADQTLSISDSELLTYLSDPENDSLLVGAIFEAPLVGTLEDTGNGFLYTPGAAAPVLEVDVDNIEGRGPNGGYATPFVQSFIPQQANLAGVDAYHYGGAGSSGDVTFKIWNNPVRAGTPLYVEERFGVPTSTVGALLEYRFDPISVIPGVPYYLEFTSTIFMGISLSASRTDFYPEGQIIERGGSNTAAAWADLYFRTYHDPDFTGSTGLPPGVTVAMLSDPEIAPNQWVVNGTNDTVVLYETGAAADAPGNERIMAVDLETQTRSFLVGVEPRFFYAGRSHPAVWFHTGEEVHRYDPTASPKLVSVPMPALFDGGLTSEAAVDPRNGDLHYCRWDFSQPTAQWYRLNHADGATVGPYGECDRLDNAIVGLKIGRRMCALQAGSTLFCTDIDGRDMSEFAHFPNAWPTSDVRVLGVQQVGDAALVFVAREEFATVTDLQTRLIREERDPDPFASLDDNHPVLLEQSGQRIERLPGVVELPDGGAVIAYGELSTASGGSDQVELHHWTGDPADETLTKLNTGVVPTAEGDTGALAMVGDELYWQLQIHGPFFDERVVYLVDPTPGATDALSEFAFVQGTPTDAAPVDLLRPGSTSFGYLDDSGEGADRCDLYSFTRPEGLGLLGTEDVHCRNHESVPGAGLLFELTSPPSLFLFGVEAAETGLTSFKVEINDPGGKRAILTVEIEVLAP